MDGYRLCHEVRKDAALRRLPFILYSSTYKSPADVRLCGTVGADRFIAKPAPLAVILEALQLSAQSQEQGSARISDEAVVFEQYSSVLEAKLEKKNLKLQLALDVSLRARRRIRELNVSLESRVRKRTAELVTANHELSAALAEVRQLNALLPICSFCKSIRYGKDYWESVESYITNHTNSQFSHGVCPACYETHYAPQLKNLHAQAAPSEAGAAPSSLVQPASL
jgi:CheY-like chemotaxis protein